MGSHVLFDVENPAFRWFLEEEEENEKTIEFYNALWCILYA